jgi:hypothetical protein
MHMTHAWYMASKHMGIHTYMHTIHAYIHTYIQIHTHTHVQMYGAPVNEAMPLMNAIATPNLGHVYHVGVNGTWHQNEWG